MSKNVWSCMKGAFEGFECKDAKNNPAIWGWACANECVISLQEKLRKEQNARREAEEKLSQRADGTGAIPPANLPPPVNLPAGADGVEAGKKPWSVCSLVDLPGIGIEFSQFHTDKYFKFVCWWHNAETKEGHVYEMTVREWGIPAVSADVPRWRALGQANGQAIFSLESSSKRIAIECGLSAFRRYLIRGHRAAWRTWRKARAAQSQAAQEAQS